MKKNCFALAVLFASLALTGCQKKIKVYEEDENHMVFKNYQNEIIDHKKWDTVQRCQYDKSLFKININCLGVFVVTQKSGNTNRSLIDNSTCMAFPAPQFVIS